MIKKILKTSVQYSKITDSLSLIKQQHPSLLSRKFKYFFHVQQDSQKKSPMESTMIIKNDDETLSRAHKICSDHLGGSWSKISPREMSLIPISGGVSNSVFCCSLPDSIMISDGEQSQALLRFYGDYSRNCDISIQLEIFNLLSTKNLGPKLYGKFEEGRLEEFLQADSLTGDELRNHEISSIIAGKVAAVHSLDIPMDRNNTWLKEKLDEWVEFIHDSSETSISEDTRESTIEIAQELLTIDFDEEIKFINSILERTSSPLVFSHNDLHQGNILLARYSKRRPTLEERVVLIDFEYCSYNYRAYDIANHFCEWCFDYDTQEYPHFIYHTDKFPSKDAQRNFIRHYLKRRRNIVSSLKTPANGATNGNHNTGNDIIESIHHHLGVDIQNYDKETNEDTLLDEIKPFFMAANLLWTLWCIKNAYSATFKFGYWEHAMARWRLYNNLKVSYIEEMKAQTNGRSMD